MIVKPEIRTDFSVPNIIHNDVYFYVNKDIWCDKYKNFIRSQLYETPVFLILDTIKGTQVAAFMCVSDFEKAFELIENYINY